MSTRPSVRSENRQVRAIVTDIHRDLTGRAGCRWDGIEYYIQQEILDACAGTNRLDGMSGKVVRRTSGAAPSRRDDAGVPRRAVRERRLQDARRRRLVADVPVRAPRPQLEVHVVLAR